MTTPKQAATTVPVNVENFIRAETDMYFAKMVAAGAFGELRHRPEIAGVDKQEVVRMNRDTIYSDGVFDLDAGPLTIVLPDSGKRFMSMQVVSEDHYTAEVVYAPGRFTYSKDKVGTRYVFIIVRTLADPQDADDVKTANALQDKIEVEQASKGAFATPTWDAASRDKVRSALNSLASLGISKTKFGKKEEVDPVAHLIATAIGWGGNPDYAAVYRSEYPAANDGKTVHRVTVRDVPVDGFWSISVYNDKGFFEKNDLDAYSLNSLTAKPNPDGSFTIQFGGCGTGVPNCLPIVAGWNYTVRLYRPRKEVLDGTWRCPEAQRVTQAEI